MSAPPSLVLLALPSLDQLCCVSVTLQPDEDPRSRQIQTCRELVLLYSDLMASPALDSFSDITVVVSGTFFQRGVLQVFGQRRSLQLGCPQRVSPGVLQCCLSYSLITRLAPSWNKAGLYLISGKDFLTASGRLNAVGMELSTREGQLVLSIEANTVRLPPTRLEDFDLPPLVLRRFCSDPASVLDPSSTGGARWCHVLPSMKKGQIITITRQLPRDGPFRTYRDLQNHWNRLYGYRLPELAEEEEVYCSIYFRPVGQRLFTYPLSCVRLQPVQRCPRVDLQGALGSFLSDVRDQLRAVCGFPVRLTGKPRYHTAGLSSAAAVQVLGGEQINLSSSSSIRPVLTQLPPPPPAPLPPPPPQPVQPSSGSHPPAWSSPLTQQAGAQGLLGNGPTQSQGWRGDRDWPSSSSSSSSSSFSHPLAYQSALSLPSSSSSSSSLSLFRPASSLPPLPPPMVPIFKNKCPSRHVNVAQLRLQKQREQLIGGGGGGRGRVTLPAFRTKTAAAASSSSASSSLSAAPLPPPLPVPRFNRRPKPLSLSPASNKSRPGFLLAAEPENVKPNKSRPGFLLAAETENVKPNKSRPGFLLAAEPENVKPNKSRPGFLLAAETENVKPNKSRPGFLLAAEPENVKPESRPGFLLAAETENVKSKSRPGFLLAAETENVKSKSRPGFLLAAEPENVKPESRPGFLLAAEPVPPAASSSSRRVTFESKPKKKPRSAVRDVDVGQMARSNQLSKLNSATLLSWLKGRGVHVTTKTRKEELMLKVMGCLAEA